jgi:NAD(P)-dependent dehydrogenase (short-subunit alcohol dehydrogenase family)
MMQTVLITGASSGIGKATAKLFQARGWNVVATMRTPEQESDLNKLDNCFVTRLDVVDPVSIHAAVAAAIARFGQIDVLVNNAGYGAFGPLEAFSLDRIQRQFDTNVIGLLTVTKAVLPHFRARKNGIIVNISSIGGRVTFPFGALYNGTKFAVEGITEALQFELETIGVRVKLIEPGSIETDFRTRSVDRAVEPSISEYLTLTKRRTVPSQAFSGIPVMPEVVANVILEAATDGSSRLRYVVGEDAEQYLALRQAHDDEDFYAAIKERLGILGLQNSA